MIFPGTEVRLTGR